MTLKVKNKNHFKSKQKLEEEALQYIKTKDIDDLIKLFKTATPILRYTFKKHRNHRLDWDYDDFYSVTFMEIKRCLDQGRFDTDRGPFFNFIFMVAKCQIFNQLALCNNTKNRMLTDSISTHQGDDIDPLTEFASTGYYTTDTLGDMAKLEKTQQIMCDLADKCTVLEQLILLYYLKGHSYEVISALVEKLIASREDLQIVLGKTKVTRKSVDNSLERIKVKARALASEGILDN